MIYSYVVDGNGSRYFKQFDTPEEMNKFCEDLGSANDDRTFTKIHYMNPTMQELLQDIECIKTYEEENPDFRAN